jgi:hypothetical protein
VSEERPVPGGGERAATDKISLTGERLVMSSVADRRAGVAERIWRRVAAHQAADRFYYRLGWHVGFEAGRRACELEAAWRERRRISPRLNPNAPTYAELERRRRELDDRRGGEAA